MARLHKFRLPVRIDLMGGNESVLGVVHVRQDQRVIDMLCDERPFFPVDTKEGLLVINKAAIAKIIVADREKVVSSPDVFPGVDLDALDRRAGDMKELR